MLPLRLVAQQILSVVNDTTVVERETKLTEVRINGPGFEEARKQVDASDVTMVRDTDKGLRYLVKDEQGERVVKEGFAASKLFGAGGLFYDDSLDYPLPLAGINYFSFDYRVPRQPPEIPRRAAVVAAGRREPVAGAGEVRVQREGVGDVGARHHEAARRVVRLRRNGSREPRTRRRS